MPVTITIDQVIRNVRVYGLNESVRASSYPKLTVLPDDLSQIQGNDISRAYRLATAPVGSGHDCFLKGIVVQADFVMSQGWWLQAGRYNRFDIVSSQSKEHNCEALFGVMDPDDVKMGQALGARVTTNYLQLKTMYRQRRNHRRPEWRLFCAWCEKLPGWDWLGLALPKDGKKEDSE